MDSPRALLVACELAIAEAIRAQIRDQSGLNVRVCTYEEIEEHVDWQIPGVVLLVADGDESEATRIVQEARLRASIVRLAIIQTNPSPKNPTCPDYCLALRAQWPRDAKLVEGLFHDLPPVISKKETPATALANRLRVHTPSLLPQIGRLAVAAAHDVTVLLTGETGTGKTYLARLIHEYSPRRQHPFLMVPCGAQPTNLFESTFFGHVKGAYTGAHQSRVGRFAAAGKGTILLDEIDALGFEQQASLLRVIETGEYELVGGNETLRSEARIIVASNKDLAEEVDKDLFRQDLFYRLNVMSFHLPPLRNRLQDIPLLARGIISRFNTKFGKGLFEISADVLESLQAYSWPGNIRQLENILQEAVLTSTGRELTLRDLPELPKNELENGQLVGDQPYYTDSVNGNGSSETPTDTLLRGRAAFECALIQKALGDCRFIRSRTARALGVSRVTLYKKMKQYGLTDLPRK